MELEEKKIRENRAIEESKLKKELEKLEKKDREKARPHEINLKRFDQNLPIQIYPAQNLRFSVIGCDKIRSTIR